MPFSYAPVAQLDRVTGFEPVGREFESLRARQIPCTLPSGALVRAVLWCFKQGTGMPLKL